MALFFFDSKDNLDSVADIVGSELASLDDAKREALETLVGIAKDRLPDGNFPKLSITIRDGSAALVIISLSLEVAYLQGGTAEAH